MRSILYISVLLFLSGTTSAQKKPVQSNHRKGQVYTFWGWNAAEYGKSDMHFKGIDYDFSLYNVKAQDLPRRPLREPQNNYGIGYFFKDNMAIIFSFDHMKYVMEQNQTVHMKGTIARNGPHKGEYDGEKVLTADFLTFDHTDGLNYITLEFEKYHSWYATKNKKFMVSGMWGGGVGILNPRTDAVLLNYPRSNRYHISGYGFAAKAAAEITVLKFITGKIENKFGYINMPDVAMHEKDIEGQAKHAFFFSEMVWSIGFNFSLINRKNQDNKSGNNY